MTSGAWWAMAPGASMKGRPLGGGDSLRAGSRQGIDAASMKGRPLRGGDHVQLRLEHHPRLASMKGRPLGAATR